MVEDDFDILDISYPEYLEGFQDAVESAQTLSRKCYGIKSPTNQHYFASVIFARIITTCISLAILLPGSNWAKHRQTHWDYGSTHILARAIMEYYFMFFYYCIEKVSEDEWRTRQGIIHIHDCSYRIRLFETLGNKGEAEGLSVQLNELKEKLQKNSFFQTLPEKQQKHFLRGKDVYLYSHEEIIRRLGDDVTAYKALYQLLSSAVHALPFNFHRIGIVENYDAGRGVHSSIEEIYTNAALALALGCLKKSITYMEELFAPILEAKEEMWLPCLKPAVNETIRWIEPIWSTNKKGPQNIGRQLMSGYVLSVEKNHITLRFHGSECLEITEDGIPDPIPQVGEHIRRNNNLLQKDQCQKYEWSDEIANKFGFT